MHPELHAPRAVKLLPLDYDPAVPRELLHDVETVCKAAGLPLEQIELLGQDEAACHDFLHLARHAGVDSALVTTDWLLLESLWQARRLD